MTRLAAFSPSGRSPLTCVSHVPYVGMAPSEVVVQIGILNPNQSFTSAFGRLPSELVGKPCHDAGEKGTTLSIGCQPTSALVILPEPFGGCMQEAVNELGGREVRSGAADLEHVAALTVERAVSRDPNCLDKKVLCENHRDEPLVLADASGWLPKVGVAIVPRGLGSTQVVFEHKSLSRCHSGLGLMLMRAFRECQEACNALNHLVFGSGSFVRQSACPNVYPEPSTGGTKRGAVRGLLGFSEYFMNILMSHLVLEHFDDHAPRLLKNEWARNFERSRGGDPAPQRGASGNNFEGRDRQSAVELGFVQLVPRCP